MPARLARGGRELARRPRRRGRPPDAGRGQHRLAGGRPTPGRAATGGRGSLAGEVAETSRRGQPPNLKKKKLLFERKMDFVVQKAGPVIMRLPIHAYRFFFGQRFSLSSSETLETESPVFHGISSAAFRPGNGSHRLPCSSSSAEGTSPSPPASAARPLCNPRRKCRMSVLCVTLAFVAICLALVVICFFGRLLNGAECPTLEVTALTVSNVTVAASTGATWKASLLVERSASYGNFSSREVECFIYYHWDTAQPLAVASVAPFVLRGASRTVIEARMTMERPEAAVVRDMDREQRSIGIVVVGLGLRMRGLYVYASWWKKRHGRIEARCDNLRIAFANSTTEGSLVISDHVIIGGDSPSPPPSDNLPSCTYDD
ncbi:hypothetical protein NL676_039621 [Syzygium grande]|nr:hypothetical protein NL676_039621 [Syzygium grande]